MIERVDWEARERKLRQASAVIQRRVRQARRSINDLIEFCVVGPDGRYVRQGDIHREFQEHFEHQQGVLLGFVGSGKALPLRMEIPTDRGWVTMGDLAVGDTVYDQEGEPAKVLGKSPVYTDHRLVEFTFDDGVTVTSDLEHQWSAWNIIDRDVGRAPRTVTTAEIIKNFTRYGGRPFWKIPLAGPVQYPEQELLVDPYVLGAWLGDGTTGGASIHCGEKDVFILDECIRRCGGRPSKRASYRDGVFRQTPDAGYGRLRSRLEAIGVRDSKHVPEQYLRGSVSQRRALLAGLMDTDGTVSRFKRIRRPGKKETFTGGRMEFTSTNRHLADAVLELARSLGFKATIGEGRATLRGKDCGPKWRVCWTADTPVFRLPRKRDEHAKAVQERQRRAKDKKRPGGTRSRYDCRTIVSWRWVESEPVQCITVDSPSNTYIAGRDYIVTHNTTQVRWKLTEAIAKNHHHELVAYVSSTERHPKKQLHAFKVTVERNRRFQLVYPDLKPGERWSATEAEVQRETDFPDPTWQCFGAFSQSVLGSRANRIVFDDLVNNENTLTEYAIERMAGWVGSVLSRAVPNCWIHAVGHIWAENDQLQQWAKLPDWAYARYEALYRDPETGELETDENGDWIPTAPTILSLKDYRKKADNLGPIMTEMMLHNRLPGNTFGRFKESYISSCIRAGRGLISVDDFNAENFWPAEVRGLPTFCGVDLGHRKKPGKDKTVLFTVAVFPDNRRRVIDIRSGLWGGDEIIEQLLDVHHRYNPMFGVENNGAQQHLIDIAGTMNCLSIKAHSTGTNKWHFENGVEGIALEMSRSQWIFPCDTNERVPTELGLLLKEARMFDPSKKSQHTGDRLMAMWICRELIRQMTRQNSAMTTGGIHIPTPDEIVAVHSR